METTENHNQTMERIIKQAGGSIYTPPAEFGYSSIAILPKEVRLESLDQFLLAPRRTKASPQFETLESFAAYVNKHKVADTVIFVDVHGNATAYIDYHGPEKTTWNVHTARFNPRRSANFQTWSALCKKSGIGQRELATFIEDNIKDFLKPSGADMLEVAMNLNLTKNVVFKSDIKLRNGDVEIGRAHV